MTGPLSVLGALSLVHLVQRGWPERDLLVTGPLPGPGTMSRLYLRPGPGHGCGYLSVSTSTLNKPLFNQPQQVFVFGMSYSIDLLTIYIISLHHS